MFPQGFSCLVVLFVLILFPFRLRAFYLLWVSFPADSTKFFSSFVLGLFPFRSPLLGESMFLSLPQGT